MKRSWPTILAIVTVVVVIVVGVWAYPRGDQTPAPARAMLPIARTDGREMMCGMSLQLNSGDPDRPYEQYIDEMAAIGANTVCLVVTAYQEDASSTSLFVDLRKTPSDQRLAELIDRAHADGLKVALMPIILLENPRPGQWRGLIQPTDPEAWWEDYNDYIVHYARIAKKTGVEMFIIGSELLRLERDTADWKSLIALVKFEYDGLLSYSTNWDHYQVPTFWDDLDVVGMTTYFDLTGGDEPTVPRLMNGWAPIRRDILDWQAKVGKPIIFTEVGWPNQITCAQAPWDYTRNRGKPAPQWQANCFEAFFRTWGDQPSVAGALIWEWRNDPTRTYDESDPSYVPCGKPALTVIEHYFRLLGRPTDPAAQPDIASGREGD